MSTNKNGRVIFFTIAFLFGAVLFAFSPAQANAASYFFSPSSAAYHVGETFQTSVYVSSTDQPINICQAYVNYPKDILKVVSVSTKSSIFSFTVENSVFSNEPGVLNISGVILNPGYTGSQGKLVTISFYAKEAGAANVTIPAGQVLANDGLGTEILVSRGSATFTILPAKIVEKPDKALPAETSASASSAVNITTCSFAQLPFIFLKLGPLVFGNSALTVLLFIILLIIFAIISLWKFWKNYINKKHVKNLK